MFFGLAGLTLILFFFVKHPKPEESEFIDASWLCESPIEKRVYNGLALHGLRLTPQYKVGKYRIDLAFPHQMIAIECDGKAYHSTPKQKAHDRKKDKFLKEHG